MTKIIQIIQRGITSSLICGLDDAGVLWVLSENNGSIEWHRLIGSPDSKEGAWND